MNKKTLEKLSVDAEAFFNTNPPKLGRNATKTQRVVRPRNGSLPTRTGTRQRNKPVGEILCTAFKMIS